MEGEEGVSGLAEGLAGGQEKLQERVFVFLAVETLLWCSCNFCPKKWLVEGKQGVSGASEGADWGIAQHVPVTRPQKGQRRRGLRPAQAGGRLKTKF